MKNFSDFIYNVKSSKNIVIISHIGPDGDTLGSALALYSLICEFDGVKRIDCIINGKIPDIYKFLPGIEEMKTPYDKDVYDNYDLAIAVDCAAIDRMGDALSIFKKAKKTVNIDHHVTGKKFADINIIKQASSSTGEVIFDLVKALELEFMMMLHFVFIRHLPTRRIQFDNTTGHTSALQNTCKTRINPSEVYRKCYKNKRLLCSSFTIMPWGMLFLRIKTG
jgi:phosphoesterase RecJ-like protein